MGFFNRLRLTAARRAIQNELMPGEKVLLEGEALFEFTDGVQSIWPEVLIAVTKHRFLWAMLRRPDAGAPSMRFDRLVRFEEAGKRVHLTERDSDWAEMAQDPMNPLGEVDAVFEFDATETSQAVRTEIVARARGSSLR